MDQEPKLRAIPPGGPGTRSEAARGSRDSPAAFRSRWASRWRSRSCSWSGATSRWARGSTRSRAQTQRLNQAIAERDDVISAQRTRLDEVRGRVQELLQLLDQPVPGTAPATPSPATRPGAPEPAA